MKKTEKKNGGARPGSGRKSMAKKLDELTKDGQAKVYAIMEADFWVRMANDKAAPRLAGILDSKDSKDENVIAAAKEVLNRALGKSKESIDVKQNIVVERVKYGDNQDSDSTPISASPISVTIAPSD